MPSLCLVPKNRNVESVIIITSSLLEKSFRTTKLGDREQNDSENIFSLEKFLLNRRNPFVKLHRYWGSLFGNIFQKHYEYVMNTSLKILFADDELSLQELMRLELPSMGHQVTVCPDGTTAMAALERNGYDCLLVDLDMPGADGLEVIEAARKFDPYVDAVILTGKGTMETAIAALRNGAIDYLTKPCRLADVEATLNRVARKRELNKKYLAVKSQLKRIEGGNRLIGSSLAMQRVHHLISKIAPTDSTVVILGETGTGKELAARAVHDKSLRVEQPFVAINCGALPENLIESELFGHRKGSFTGADEHRAGLIEVANKGTLFLDEIGELPKGVQAKLLRFLESGEVRRIGENQSVVCDVRVVCATLRNLEEMVRIGDFREDLWFRINTFEIHLPPLRERLEDLPELIQHLAKRYANSPAAKLRSGHDLFTKEAFAIMQRHPWPGNVRQLANVIEHAVILSDEIPIGHEALPQPFLRMQQSATANRSPNATTLSIADVAEMKSFDIKFDAKQESARSLRSKEMEAIYDALARHNGNKNKVAEELGISLKTLYNKLNQLDAKKIA
ncbi:MAG: sigma-54 dependent transcriptional regulator [Planctomycetaceae bacterium]|nr:sigma-54 dependent transcriptional regulator [Planctomycetaceae bacterium]